MTGEGLAASLAWSGVVGYVAWRADLLVQKALALRSAEHADAVKVKTQQIESAERIAVAQADEAAKAKMRNRAIGSIEIPDDLEAVAMQESEGWARDNERQLMRERFVELAALGGTEDEVWQKVRRAVGVGEMPE